MKRTGRKQEWSLTIFAVGGMVFFPPVVGLIDKPTLVLGLPLAYVVMFGVWALIILGIWLGARPSPLRGDLSAHGTEDVQETPYDAAPIPPGDRAENRLGRG